MHGPGGKEGTGRRESGRSSGDGVDRDTDHDHSTHAGHSRSAHSGSTSSKTATETVGAAPVHTHGGTAAVSSSRSGGSGFVAGLLLALLGLTYPLYLFVDATPTWLILLVVGFVLVAVAVLWRERSRQKGPTDEEYGPVDRLRAQYASGEIDEEELGWRLEELGADRSEFERVPGDEGTTDVSGGPETATFESIVGGRYPVAGFDEPRTESTPTAPRVGGEPAPGLRETPETRLRTRFAAGEIDEAAFTHKLEVLRETEVRTDE